MTLFRICVTNPRLDMEREYETPCEANRENRKSEPRLGKTVYGRYALRNHLKSSLRQKLGRQ